VRTTLSNQLAERTEVIAARVRKVPGYAQRYVIPVAVAEQTMLHGPWARNAALEYAERVLRLREPGVNPPDGVRRPYAAYMAAADTLPQDRTMTVEELKAASAHDRQTADAAAGEKRWVIEITVDGV
jgi:hypothetical protein